MGGSKNSWGSRLGVILAVAGSAIGLGNFLRFPGVAVANGGGSFMIPYIAAFLIVGLPIAWIEWSMGRSGGAKGYNSSAGIFRALLKKDGAAYFGVLGLIIPLVIYMYYVLIEAWCLGYAWKYWTGAMRAVQEEGKASSYIWEFSGATAADGSLFSSGWASGCLPFVLICFAINFVLIYRGVNKGIEWFCKWAMPALILCAILILVRVLTLGTPDPAQPDKNIINGLGFMWNPVGHTIVDGAVEEVPFWTSLANPDVWLAAAGQIFFSLSVGFGIIMTYASYMKKNDDVVLSSAAASAGNGFAEVVLGGLITIPAVFMFVPLADIVTAGSKASSLSMGFSALPGVFAQMPLGDFFGGLFFFLLFLAAVTSSLSMLQPVIAMFEEGLGLDRKGSVAILGLITLLGSGFVVYFSNNLMALDTMDFWIGSFALFVLATIQVILFGWVLGVDKGLAELDRGAACRLPRWLGFQMKYITPLFLLIIFGFWVSKQLNFAEGGRIMQAINDPVARNTMIFMGVLVIFLALVVNIAIRRWRKDEALANTPFQREIQ